MGYAYTACRVIVKLASYLGDFRGVRFRYLASAVTTHYACIILVKVFRHQLATAVAALFSGLRALSISPSMAASRFFRACGVGLEREPQNRVYDANGQSIFQNQLRVEIDTKVARKSSDDIDFLDVTLR